MASIAKRGQTPWTEFVLFLKSKSFKVDSFFLLTDGIRSLLLPDLLRDLLDRGHLHYLYYSRDQEQNLYGDQSDVRCQEQHPKRGADVQRSSQNGGDEWLWNPQQVK